jgi:release factor glutamine methyltransferase
VTVLESIQRSTQFLTRKGVDAPRLQTELLLAHLLKIPRMQLYLNFERTLTPAEVDELRELIQRRGHREPLQHITGTISFCGLELSVDRRALIPRPETEILAERGWKFLQERSRTEQWSPVALDFGTGTGCLAIALAYHCQDAQVYALDLSSAALALARQNAQRHTIARPIQFIEGGKLQALPPGLRVDLLLSNPPYIPTAEIDELQPEVRDYDPRTALDGGQDGLDVYRYLAADAPAFLNPGARLMVEMGDGQAAALLALFEAQDWVVESVDEDYNQRPRILVAHRSPVASVDGGNCARET